MSTNNPDGPAKWNHPFEGPELFDDTLTLESMDPWPTVSQAVRDLVAARYGAK